AAWAEYMKYSAHPCEYIIDPTLGKTFGIKYDSLNCENLGSLFAQPAQPSAQYYEAVGTQAVYNPLGEEPAVAETLLRLPAFAEIALSGSVVGATVPAAFIGGVEVFQTIAPFAGRAFCCAR